MVLLFLFESDLLNETVDVHFDIVIASTEVPRNKVYKILINPTDEGFKRKKWAGEI